MIFKIILLIPCLIILGWCLWLFAYCGAAWLWTSWEERRLYKKLDREEAHRENARREREIQCLSKSPSNQRSKS